MPKGRNNYERKQELKTNKYWDQNSPGTHAANPSILPDLVLGTTKDLITVSGKCCTVHLTQ